MCAKLKGNETRPVIQETDTLAKVWGKLALDLVGPMVESHKGYKYVLTCQDLLTKCIVIAPLRGITSEEVANKLMKHIILKYGIPLEILTDQGSQFISEIFKELTKLLYVIHVCCSVYHSKKHWEFRKES